MFECCCSYDDEQAQFFYERMIVGKKDHKCCECHKIIKKGVEHRLTTMKFEGEWSKDRTCKTCVAIREDFGDCQAVGYLKDSLINCGWEPELLGF